MLRRFFYELEQSVETLWGNHVCFIENKDFVAITSWSKHSAFAEISGVINTIMTSGVNLDDIEGATSVAGEFDTTGAHTTRSICGAFDTVKTSCQDAC